MPETNMSTRWGIDYQIPSMYMQGMYTHIHIWYIPTQICVPNLKLVQQELWFVQLDRHTDRQQAVIAYAWFELSQISHPN